MNIYVHSVSIFKDVSTRMHRKENGMLRKTFAPKRDEVTGKWRRQEKEKLYDLYLTPNTIQVITSRRLSGAWNIAWGKGEVTIGIWLEGHTVGDHLEDLGTDGRIPK